MEANWQLIRLRMTLGPLSFALHGLMTSRYRGESAVCLPSGRRGISPLIRSSVIKLLCHASPVLPRFRVNGSHLFQPWANPNPWAAIHTAIGLESRLHYASWSGAD